LPASPAEVTAVRLRQPADASGFPIEQEWERANPVSFCHDWQGKNEDPQRSTEVKVLWTLDHIYLRFCCRYRSIHVFSDSDPSGRGAELWDRDVAEVFLQPDRFGEKYYREFEVSPNGLWLDLDITPQGLRQIASGMSSRVSVDESARIWSAEVVIPIGAVTSAFNPEQSWRVNFFRCEGLDPERFYSAWQPTQTEMPNFHVPQKFGQLRFEP
jgi:alpha-galactosidase